MKILLVTDQFFSANNGMTISSRRFANVLAAHGHEVRVAAAGKPGDTEYLMKKQYIPVFDGLISSQGMTFAKPDKRLIKSAVEWADVVHFLVPFALSHVGEKICRENGVPYTAAFHVQPENITSSIHMAKVTPINDAIYWWFNKYFYSKCSHIHCPSNFIANQLKLHGYRGQLHVISNGIDPDFSYCRTEHEERFRDKFVILNVGRLSIEKRQDVLLNAVSRTKYRDKIAVRLAGQGPRRDKLTALASRLGVECDIGFYPKDELIRVISSSDLYVHPADAEIEAMSCMEAFACGLVPVISDSPKSATPQFALDGRSLFKAGDPDDLAQKIEYWIEHEDERNAVGLEYSHSAEEYELDRCVQSAEEMFRLAIAEAKEQNVRE